MKHYDKYMDDIKVSDTLHRRLVELEPPQKRPAAWKKAGGLAAAVVLVAGVGAWGLSRGGRNAIMDSFHPTGDWGSPVDHFDPAVGTAEINPENIGEPDIAIEDPDGPFVDPDPNPGLGGYEVVEGGLAHYYVLPYLNWVDASVQPQTAADYALAPPSAIHRDATLKDALIFTGDINGSKPGHNWANHLQWDHMDWGGTLWFLEDGTPQAAALYADETGLHLSLEVMKGGKVPSCIVFPEDSYEYSTWGGVEITALKNGGYMVTDDGVELREKREVSFFFEGVGYKLTLYADDDVRANDMCARFVRYAIDSGFHLDALAADGTAPVRSSYSVGEPNWEDGVPDEDSDTEDFYCDCPDCVAGIPHTHPYDPSASDVDMVMTAPPYSAP